MNLKKWPAKNPELTIALGILLATLCYLFKTGFSDPSQTVWSSDYTMSLHRDIVTSARHLAPLQWNLTYFLGYVGENMFYANWPILALFPVGVSMWLNVLIHFLIAGCGAYFCSRQMGIGKYGAALAAVGMGLTSHIVSLTSQGHIYKIQSLPWLPWVFGFYLAAWQKGCWKRFAAAAMCFALAFQGGEPQVPYYAGLYLALLTLILLIQDLRTKTSAKAVAKKTGFAMGCAALTLLLSFQTLANFANFSSKNATAATALSDDQSPETLDKENYNFCTGWSFPPEDITNFLMTGKISGGSTPAYFGRMGQDNMILRLNDDYMGVAICILALGGILAGRKNRVYPFLLFMLISSILIAFGKYTPLYELIYKLPTMSSQRVPARWIFFTALSLNLLAAIGLESLIASIKERTRKRFIVPVLAGTALAIVLLAGMTVEVGSDGFKEHAFGINGQIAPSASTELAELRADNFQSAFHRTGWLLLLLTGISTAAGLHKNHRTIPLALAGSLMFLTACDLGENGTRFIKFYDWKQYHATNDLIHFFQQDKDIYRIQPLGTQAHPLINQLVGPIGTWHYLRFTEMTAMHRVQNEFATMYRELKTEKLPHQLNPQFYDLMNVKYVLSAYQLQSEILKFSRLKPVKQFSFGQYPPVIIYEYTAFKPFAEFASIAIRTESDEAALLAACHKTNSAVTVLSPDVATIECNEEGATQLTSCSYSGMKVKTASKTNGWLILKALLPQGLSAKVNGKNVPVIKSHGLYPAVALPPGENVVTLKINRFNRSQLVALLSWLIILSALIAANLKKHTSCHTA